MAFVESWDESLPTDATYMRDIDNYIRSLKVALRERLAVEHVFAENESGVSDIGKHKKGSARVAFGTLAERPNPSANADMQGSIYITTDEPDGCKGYLDNGTWLHVFSSAVSPAPTGAIVMFGGTTPPVGWLECNGSAVSRTTYANLFAVIGVSFGVGDGINTFNLPDFRGVFPRGWDHGRGKDPGRTFGSYQEDEFKSHTHSYIYRSTEYNTGMSGMTCWSYTSTQQTGATGGSETRPKNLAVMFIIKT